MHAAGPRGPAWRQAPDGGFAEPGAGSDTSTTCQAMLAGSAEGEQVLEVYVTPDRGYCFSIRGIAREYALSTGAAFTDHGVPTPERLQQLAIDLPQVMALLQTRE